MQYTNNSNYRNDSLIKKELNVSMAMLEEVKRITDQSDILKESDDRWPKRNKDGREELEIKLGNKHVSFETAKIALLSQVSESDDPEGLRVFYYLVQDLKALVFSLISMHFKVRTAPPMAYLGGFIVSGVAFRYASLTWPPPSHSSRFNPFNSKIAHLFHYIVC